MSIFYLKKVNSCRMLWSF